MESILVVYKSKTGFTKKYVDWITEVITCQTITYDEMNRININDYKIIIYGAGIKAGHIQGLKEFKKKIRSATSHKIVVFATGGAPGNEDIVSKIKTNNFSAEELNRIQFFYFQSGLNYEKMGLSARAMMSIYKKILELKQNKSAVEAGTSKALSNSYDLSSSEHIKPMIAYINQLHNRS